MAETGTLNAFLVALAELDDAEQVPYLKAHAESALDVVESNEREYYSFLGECALLAHR